MAAIIVRYFGSAAAAAGRRSETVVAATVAEAIEAVASAHGPDLRRVLQMCSFLLDGTAVHDHAIAPRDGAELDVLPPFAGG